MDSRFAYAEDFDEPVAEPQDLVDEIRQDKPEEKKESGPEPLQLTQGRAIVLTAEQQKMLADQLVVNRGPKGIDGDHADLISKAVGSDIAFCTPGADDLSFIASAKDTLPYLVNAQNDILTSTSNQRIPIIYLLKLVTMRMTLHDR